MVDINRLLNFRRTPGATEVGNLLQRFARSEAKKLGNALQQVPTEDFLLNAPNALRQGFGDVPLRMGAEEATDIAMQFGPGAFGGIKALGGFKKAIKPITTPAERVDVFHNSVALAQRGAPEQAMVKLQKQMGGGVFGFGAEHIGDLTHRMSERATSQNGGFDFVGPKVDRVLNLLKSRFGFRKEMNQNIANNAEFFRSNPGTTGFLSFDEGIEVAKKAGKEFADAHSKIPVFNEVQKLARDAAIAYGRHDFDGAVSRLQRLSDFLGEGSKGWTRRAHQVDFPGGRQ